VLGSLIGLLSLELHEGAQVYVIADGTDEVEAAGSIRELLEAG
jgi:phosphotransferase system HPr-like phosphotransfer protein